MPNTINIPTPLRPFTDKKEAVEVNGATVGELLTDLTTRYEGLRKHLYTEVGRLRNFVNERNRYGLQENRRRRRGQSRRRDGGWRCRYRPRAGARRSPRP